MTIKTNTQRLRDVKSRYGLTYADIAIITGKHAHAVDKWFVDPDKSSFIEIPDNTLELLEIKAHAYAAAKKLAKRKS